jgi:hypothetical protein
MKPKKPEIKLEDVKKTVNGFNPKVMSVVRGGVLHDDPGMNNSVCSCHMGEPGVFIKTSCGCPCLP